MKCPYCKGDIILDEKYNEYWCVDGCIPEGKTGRYFRVHSIVPRL